MIAIVIGIMLAPLGFLFGYWIRTQFAWVNPPCLGECGRRTTPKTIWTNDLYCVDCAALVTK
jgi:hypothetical protein